MPRGSPNAKPSAGAAQSRAQSDVSLWDTFAAAALTGALHRGNQNSKECAEAAAFAADRMMEFRAERFGKVEEAPTEPEAEAE